MGAQQNLSGVTVKLKALHFDPIMDEGWHRHTFKVTAYRLSEPWTDGRAARAALKTLLHTLAPKVDGVRRLPEDLWSNEALAKACLILGNVVKVKVKRRGFRVVRWAR